VISSTKLDPKLGKIVLNFKILFSFI